MSKLAPPDHKRFATMDFNPKKGPLPVNEEVKDEKEERKDGSWMVFKPGKSNPSNEKQDQMKDSNPKPNQDQLYVDFSEKRADRLESWKSPKAGIEQWAFHEQPVDHAEQAPPEFVGHKSAELEVEV